MRRRTRTVIVAATLTTALGSLVACGGRTDGGNPGNLVPDTTTSTPRTGGGG